LNKPGRKSYLLARICLLAPDAVADSDQVLQLAEEAVRAERDSHELHTLGLAHCRAGQHDESIKLFHESIKADARWAGLPVDWLALALAHHGRGEAAEARQWFDRAVRLIDKAPGSLHAEGPTGLAMHPHDWLSCLVFRHEAEVLFKGGGK
jgi:tetratricopeptide (TPR) repeat protein